MNDRIQHYCRSRKYSGLVIEGGLDYLLVRWSTLVRQLREPYKRGIDEFRNDLDGRTIIEELLPLATDEERSSIAGRLLELDDAFRELTVPSSVPVSRLRKGDPDRWWNYRLPAGLQLPGGGGRFDEFQKPPQASDTAEARRDTPPSAEEKPRGFTLVELLVVIGIVAVLIAILLPVLNKAREAANRVKCMSNLRQLSAAFIMYANNNRGSFPGAADGYWGLTRTPRDTDWVYWQPGRDLDQSAIAPYLGARGDTMKAVLRCPSDILPPRPDVRPGATEPLTYDYSYQMNFLLDGNPFEGPMPFYVPPRLQQVRRTSEKILLGESDGRLLTTASWYIGAGSGVGPINIWRPAVPVSIRHDQPSGLIDPLPTPGPPANPDRRGNVAFCDGHVEFVPRSFVALREHADPRY